MLQGALNFRDLGGFRTADGRAVRSGQVFRSNSLQELTPDDVATLVESVGIRTVVDLRDAGEVANDGRGPLEAHDVRWVSASMRRADQVPGSPNDTFTTLANRYWDYLEAGPEIVGAIEALADSSSHPAVFHCSAGKDRTGVLAAVLLSLLGVPDDQIVADYTATAHERERLTEFLRRRPSYVDTVDHFHPDLMSSDPETMAEFLARLRAEHGGARAWAEANGLAPETVSLLEAALLEAAVPEAAVPEAAVPEAAVPED